MRATGLKTELRRDARTVLFRKISSPKLDKPRHRKFTPKQGKSMQRKFSITPPFCSPVLMKRKAVNDSHQGETPRRCLENALKTPRKWPNADNRDDQNHDHNDHNVHHDDHDNDSRYHDDDGGDDTWKRMSTTSSHLESVTVGDLT